MSIDMRHPVLCGYEMDVHVGSGRWEKFPGAIMIHVFRSADIRREFDLAMRARGSGVGFKMTWFLPQCEQAHF